MTETLKGFDLFLSFSADKQFVAGFIENIYEIIRNDGSSYTFRDRSKFSDLANTFPSSAILLQVEQYKKERDDALKAKNDAALALEEANVKIENLQKSDTTPEVINNIPQQVSPYQARAALLAAGLLDTINELVKTESEEIQLAWEYATVFYRTSPMIIQFASKLNLNDEQVDQLFIAASQIT